jgi:glycosyltransferase involved in cell wall biosynthesis
MIAPLYDEVDLCAPVFDRSKTSEDAKLDITNLKLKALPPYYRKSEITAIIHPFKLIKGFWPHIKKADAVLINIPNYLGIWAWLVCLFQRKRFAIRMAGNWPQYMKMAFYNHKWYLLGNIAFILHKILLWPMIKTSTVTFAHGKELADIYSRRNKQVVRVISSTIHDKDIADEIASGPDDKCTILYVGRLQFSKGLNELLQAVKDLRKEGIDFCLKLAGDGARREFYEQLAKDLEINNDVDFCGWIAIENLKEVYRNSDIFVFPSYSETGPKVVIEAMANGLPVVVTKVGSVPVVMKEGVTGFVIPIKDTQTLKEAIKILILDEPLRKRFAQAALERAHLFTMEAERECVKQALEKFGLLDKGDVV